MKQRPPRARLVVLIGIAAALLAFASLAVVSAQQADLGFGDAIAGYFSWDRANSQKSPIESAHPTHKDVYFNEPASQAARSGTFPFPEGSVIVKETLSPETLQVPVITAMRKVPGFAPNDGDWQYAMFERQDDGTFAGDWMPVEAAGMCMQCHAGAADSDFVFLSYLD